MENTGLKEFVLKEMLFRSGELLDIPAIGVLIFLPVQEIPAQAEILMLERMLTALGFASGQWRYVYHEGEPDWRFVSEWNPVILFFLSKMAPVRLPELKKETPYPWFSLPPLSEISADNSMKRLVWDLIKN